MRTPRVASDHAGRLLLGLWAGITLQVAGQLLDLRWHLTHGGFETATDQLQAHWLIWLGLLVTLPVAALGSRSIPSRWYGGYRLLLLAWMLLALSEVWHFWEHLHLRDPVAPHVLLVLGKLAVLAGAISATVASRRWTGPLARPGRSAPP